MRRRWLQGLLVAWCCDRDRERERGDMRGDEMEESDTVTLEHFMKIVVVITCESE